MKTSMQIMSLVMLSIVPILGYSGTSLVSTEKVVPDIIHVLQDARRQVNIKLEFPQLLPSDAKLPRYYVHGEHMAGKYVLNIDSTADCYGVKVCNMGMITAEVGANPQIYYNRDNKEITVPVTLAHGLKGYYTPGHAMGDYFPARVEWRNKNVLYSFIWPLDDKAAMLKIVGSVTQE